MRDSSTTPDKETVRITRCAVGMNEQILNDFFNTIRNPQAMPVFCKFSKLLSGILSFYEKKVFKKNFTFFQISLHFFAENSKKIRFIMRGGTSTLVARLLITLWL